MLIVIVVVTWMVLLLTIEINSLVQRVPCGSPSTEANTVHSVKVPIAVMNTVLLVRVTKNFILVALRGVIREIYLVIEP